MRIFLGCPWAATPDGARLGLAFCWIASHGENRPVFETVFDLVHEPLDQIHSAPTVTINVVAFGWIGKSGGVKAETGVSNHDGYSTTFLDLHGQAYAFYGVATVAMEHGVAERFSQRGLDIPQFPAIAVLFQESNDPAHRAFDIPRARGN